MAQTTLELYNQERERLGLEPVDALPGETAPKNEPAANSNTDTPPTQDSNPPANPGKIVVSELTDDLLLQALKDRGIDATSLDALKPAVSPIDPKIAAEQRESAKLSYALSNGLVKKEEYEEFIKDSTDLTSLAYRHFYNEQKSDDSELTDDEIKSEFEERFGLNTEEGSRKYKSGQNQLKLYANALLKNKHQRVLSIDSAYDKHENSVNSLKSEADKIIAEAPKYKADVNNVFEGMGKIKIPIDGTDIEVDIPIDTINLVKNSFFTDSFAKAQIKKGWTKEEIKDIAETALYRAAVAFIAESAAKSYHSKKVAGTHGIPSLSTTPQRNGEAMITDEIANHVKETYGYDPREKVQIPVAN